jgi:glycosyltransferase involved in cell wall biosynthesis
MSYFTALRSYALKRIEEIGRADLLIGIPCYNNERTITHVIQMVTHGLDEHYRGRKSLIFIADGGSTDDTREVAKEFQIKPWEEKLVSIYRGPAGKGSALRSVFEAAGRLKVKACAVVDSDLRSITSDWVKYLLEPVLEGGFDFVSPVYLRHKYDGTITNNIVYNLTRVLYGKRIRQPIGGDFAFSADVARFYSAQDVWDTDVARYGIDIWMTTMAITKGFRICQSNLGVKIHDAKDPGLHLGPMFRQVMWTLFSLMETFESYWKKVKGSEPVETFGHKNSVEPEPISVNLELVVQNFKTGYQQFASLWKDLFCRECFEQIEKASTLSSREFHFPTETWIQILYELAATFHTWSINRNKLIDLVTPLYYARVASFVRQTWEMTSAEAEAVVEEQARLFEEHKDYLLRIWEAKEAQKSGVSKSG